MENGAHGSIGMSESSAFALLPAEVPVLPKDKSYIRALDLRKAALDYLAQYEAHAPFSSRRPHKMRGLRSRLPGVIRIMTYNTHSCIGMDGKISPERIARVISRYQPDVVALQELDVGRRRTEHVDQAHIIAEYLKMEYSFHPSFYVEEELYGNAILSRFPMRLIKADILPSLERPRPLEPRGALWASIDFHGVEVRVINTHLGLNKKERVRQVEELLGTKWLGTGSAEEPTILCGDFNFLPSSPAYKMLCQNLVDAQRQIGNQRPKMTFSGRFPSARIDHVFVDHSVKVLRVETPTTELIRTASDHLPLIVDLQLRLQQ